MKKNKRKKLCSKIMIFSLAKDIDEWNVLTLKNIIKMKKKKVKN